MTPGGYLTVLDPQIPKTKLAPPVRLFPAPLAGRAQYAEMPVRDVIVPTPAS
jgi:hypothetical protein